MPRISRLVDALVIRPACPDDFTAIDQVQTRAFESTQFGHQGEAGLVRAIHADGDTVISLVAERDGAILGHVLFSRMRVEADGAEIAGAALAPIGVLPDMQSSGIGAALIRAGLDLLRDRSVQISFVLGHPHYYPRFGYSAEAARVFASPYAGSNFMALWLDKPARLPESGIADYAPAFSRGS